MFDHKFPEDRSSHGGLKLDDVTTCLSRAAGTNVARRMNEIKLFRQRSFLNDLCQSWGGIIHMESPRFFAETFLANSLCRTWAGIGGRQAQ